jgi:uncharacterized protein (TIGR01777 family)
MNIFITGGTGFIGSILARRLTEQGHRVTILTRSLRANRPPPQGVSFLEGDPTKNGDWQEKVPDHDVVINLAGASIFKRWTKKYKMAIRDSRISTTRNLVEALSVRKGNVDLLLSASAVGYYGFHGDEELDEGSSPGDDFLATVTREWEASSLEAEGHGVRVLPCRFGIVLGAEGGAIGKMILPFEWYLGSPLGTGNQWFSWIHQQDLVDIILFLMDTKDISGPINATAPHPVRNRELTRVLGQVLKKPTFMPPVPGFIIKLIMGEFGSVLLRGQRVLPKKLTDIGFRFQYPDIRRALEDLLVG